MNNQIVIKNPMALATVHNELMAIFNEIWSFLWYKLMTKVKFNLEV